ncbi:hypothetical protein B0H11DRAFT_2279129 [Mycena galericulata]|nr:hypothetical protein B0H11DRAFT_2279129 [Mycena galericulata]
MSGIAKPNPSRSELLLRIQRLESDVSFLKESSRGKIDDEIVDSKPPLMDVRRLPLKASFRGSTAVEGQCCLTWDEATVAIRFSATLAAVIKLDITREVHTITHLSPDEVGQGNPVMELVHNSVNPDGTKQVVRATLQFDGMHPDWSGARYGGLIEWLNARARGRGIVVSGCRPLVAETIWDNAARVAHWRTLENEILDAKTVVIPVINAVTAAAVGSNERGRSAAAQNVHIRPYPAGAAMVHREVKNGASLQTGKTAASKSTPIEPLQNLSIQSMCPSIPPGPPPSLGDRTSALELMLSTPAPDVPKEFQRVGPTNSPSAASASSAHPTGRHLKPSTTNKALGTAWFLPIKAWYLGRKLFEEPHYLMWAPTGKLTIKSGDALSFPSRHIEEADLPSLAKCVWFVDPKEEFPDKVVVLETYEKNKRQKPFGANYPLYFKQGASHGEGDIMLKFNTESSAWTIAAYTAFVDWLQIHVQFRLILRGRAGLARWDTSNRMAVLAETRVRRETGSNAIRDIPKKIKKPPVPGLPFLDDWRQGRPNPPIEPTAASGSISVTTRSGSKRHTDGEGDSVRTKKRKI